MTIDPAIWTRALARMDEVERLYPASQEPKEQVEPRVVKPKARKVVRPKPKQVQKPRETTKPKEEKESVHFAFAGRALDEPLFHAALDIFGQDPDDMNAVDRNTIQEVIEMAAEKIGSTDAQKILQFISRESHKYGGPYRFREMRRMLAFSL